VLIEPVRYRVHCCVADGRRVRWAVWRRWRCHIVRAHTV